MRDHPLEVYRFLRDEVKTNFIQFIPIVERDNDTGFQEGDTVTNRSVKADQYGRFLIAIFDEWVRKDVGRTYVQIFDVALAAWSGVASWNLCLLTDLRDCHGYGAQWRYVLVRSLCGAQILSRQYQREEHGQSSRLQESSKSLARISSTHCLNIAVECEVRFACNGECPKNRFIKTPDGEPGLNYLCAGYKEFFKHIDGPMRFMAHELRQGRAPANVMNYMKDGQSQISRVIFKPGRNDPCPCGSGLKYKKCHGKAG